jgi:hypothetical protein
MRLLACCLSRSMSQPWCTGKRKLGCFSMLVTLYPVMYTAPCVNGWWGRLQLPWWTLEDVQML